MDAQAKVFELIGKRMRRHRLKQQLSVHQVCMRADICEALLARIEHGRPMTVLSLLRACRGLAIPAATILKDIPHNCLEQGPLESRPSNKRNERRRSA